jgi:hypothetical protein
MTIHTAKFQPMKSQGRRKKHVYFGSRIWLDDETGLENLARYIVRACFSQQRMVYIAEEKRCEWC